MPILHFGLIQASLLKTGVANLAYGAIQSQAICR
jgi:hypothetical protein